MKMDLELRGFSPHTQDAYLGNMRRYLDHFGKPPTELGHEEIKEYLHYLITVRKVSRSCVSIAYSALKFFYETTLQQKWHMEKIPRTKVNKKLPIVLSKDEIKEIFDCITNIKHKAMLMTTYAAGLRVSETANLKISDIDSRNMLIRIDQGKGNKDRYSVLSKKKSRYIKRILEKISP
jgi:site-specific recombinase XerD